MQVDTAGGEIDGGQSGDDTVEIQTGGVLTLTRIVIEIEFDCSAVEQGCGTICCLRTITE
jgi:hypothetical protein